jgi:hypothetical protein
MHTHTHINRKPFVYVLPSTPRAAVFHRFVCTVQECVSGIHAQQRTLQEDLLGSVHSVRESRLLATRSKVSNFTSAVVPHREKRTLLSPGGMTLPRPDLKYATDHPAPRPIARRRKTINTLDSDVHISSYNDPRHHDTTTTVAYSPPFAP